MSAPQPSLPPISGPSHVAIIMDGNGRWAKSRGLPRTAGHKRGSEALTNLLESSRDLGIRYLTLYAFSAENWQRPSDEVQDLMALLHHYLDHKQAMLKKHRIRLRVIGDLSLCDAKLADKIRQSVDNSREYDGLHLTMALSYGSRQELCHAARRLAEQVKAGTLQPDEISETRIADALYTHDLPEPDLLIRTGGEMRLSNFLLWQSAYTELFFTDRLWPDFTTAELRSAIDDYQRRERRYGTVAG